MLSSDLKSWPEAEYQCEKYGGTITSVHSRQDNEFIKNLYDDGMWRDLWLGLHRDDDGKRFLSGDGGRGHSYSGGDTLCKAVKITLFSITLTQRSHIFSQNCELSPRAPGFSFQHQIMPNF